MKERILQVGFLMILALISVILYNDLAKNLPRNSGRSEVAAVAFE